MISMLIITISHVHVLVLVYVYTSIYSEIHAFMYHNCALGKRFDQMFVIETSQSEPHILRRSLMIFQYNL